MAGRLTPVAPRRRRALPSLLALGVGVLHLVLVGWLGERLAAWRADAAAPPRLQAAFVRELAPAAPPVAAAAQPAAPPARRAHRAATPPAAAASAVERAPSAAAESSVEPAAAAASSAEPVPEPVPVPVPEAQPAMAAASTTELQAALADAPSAIASMRGGLSAVAPADAASMPGAPTFDWPASTRLSYVLHGYYRGEMHGWAQVEWLREGERYQVHLDVTVGLPFAPLFTRRMSSDGRIVPGGLAPRRYDEETRRAFAAPRRATLRFADDAIVLAAGRRVPALPGVQDTASQFVQLVWLFTTEPQRLQAGQQVEMPLALPREVGLWVYDVLGIETVHAPFGAVEAWHLKPRRPARPDTLAVETWIAPSLQYLPVRIRIHQDAQTWIDLTIERPPLQAVSEAGR